MAIHMMASRELRHVPRGWQHPRNPRGYFVGLSPYTTEAELRAWYVEHGWDFDEDYPDGFNPADYMPAPGDDYQIMAYETVSEGTPLTGNAFDDTPEGRLALLRDVLAGPHPDIAGSNPGIEGWAAILFGSDGLMLNIETGRFE